MKAIEDMFDRLVAAVLDEDATEIVAMADMPCTIVEDRASYTFQTHQELGEFLATIMEHTGRMIEFNTKIEAVRPFGANVFLVEFSAHRVSERFGKQDATREFALFRDTPNGMRCCVSYLSADPNAVKVQERIITMSRSQTGEELV